MVVVVLALVLEVLKLFQAAGITSGLEIMAGIVEAAQVVVAALFGPIKELELVVVAGEVVVTGNSGVKGHSQAVAGVTKEPRLLMVGVRLVVEAGTLVVAVVLVVAAMVVVAAVVVAEDRGEQVAVVVVVVVVVVAAVTLGQVGVTKPAHGPHSLVLNLLAVEVALELEVVVVDEVIV